MHGDQKTKQDNYTLGCLLYGSSNVQYVNDNGDVDWSECDWDWGVRPFWDGRCDKVGETPKFEPHHQKNRQPFLARKSQDKYKGIQKRKYHLRL